MRLGSARKVAALPEDPIRLKRMQEAAQSMARPNAAANIAEDVLALVN
jgi:UDP-N-acetylglucosamine:LPS N-acetylglucosamine transferase